MEFKKYSSIENSYRQKYIEYMKQQLLDQGDFVVQEKVHGSNFSIWCDGNEFKCAKRTSWLEPEDNHYNHMEVLERNKSLIHAIWARIVFERGPISVLTVYGELFGGSYPHEKVERDPTATKIQKGIFYTPSNMFYAFDIKVNGEYLGVEKCLELFREVGIFYAKTLFRGSFKDCLKYPNIFQTKIPQWLNLPEIENNICEGTIIKPVEPKFFGNGSRVILKNKNEKWTEKEKRTKEKAPELKLSEDEQKLFDDYVCLVTDNRLRNVLSKFGPVSQKDFGRVLADFSKDAHDEFMKDFEEEWKIPSKAVRKKIQRAVQDRGASLIRSNFVNIIDGNF